MDGNKKDHPDVEYIKRDDVGLVIAKGLAEVYKAKPNNPCDYLARWLFNFADVQKKKEADEAKLVKQKEMREQQAQEIK